MQKLLLVLFYFCLSSYASAQDKPAPKNDRGVEAPLAKSLQTTERKAADPRDVEILSDTQGVDFRIYLGVVKYTLQKNWLPVIPEIARAPRFKQGTVTIEFKITKDGTVKDIKLTQQSGDVSLDRAALAGIAESLPFRKLPDKYRSDFLWQRFHFYYNPLKTSLTDKPEENPGKKPESGETRNK